MTYIIPILHPAYVMRGQWAQDPLQPTYLAKARKIVEEGQYIPHDPMNLPPNANIFPTLQDLEQFAATTAHDDYCFIDIEYIGYLLCVGILRDSDDAYVCVRFRGLKGVIWQPSTLALRAEWLFNFLSSPVPKVCHDGQRFDVFHMEQMGFVFNNFASDTLLLAHLVYAEMRKGLAFLALTYCDMANWKTLVSPEDEQKEED